MGLATFQAASSSALVRGSMAFMGAPDFTAARVFMDVPASDAALRVGPALLRVDQLPGSAGVPVAASHAVAQEVVSVAAPSGMVALFPEAEAALTAADAGRLIVHS
jgi:hypothetical protein